MVISKAAGGGEGGGMARRKLSTTVTLLVLMFVMAMPAAAQSFRVQCPTTTITHPTAASNNSPSPYSGPTQYQCTVMNGCGGTAGNAGYLVPVGTANGAIKCQQIGGGDGLATMGDGTQTYMFAFGPLSGLADIANGQPGTEFPSVFNTIYPNNPLLAGDPATTDGAIGGDNPWMGYPAAFTPAFNWNGAVGLTGDPSVVGFVDGGASATATIAGGLVTDVNVDNHGTGCSLSGGVYSGGLYVGAPTVTFSAPTGGIAALGTTTIQGGCVTAVNINFPGAGYATAPTITFGTASNSCLSSSATGSCLTGHVDPRPIIDVGTMNGNIPAPLFAIDEDDEFFLTLSNVGMIMRPDLFEQHTVHFHGYPNASTFYDGVPDASVAINIGGSFTYYYLAPDAGTYFWHCHITPPEHLQMGMVGQLYVRPRQNRVPKGNQLYAALQQQQLDNRTKCDSTQDILCSNPLPASNMVPALPTTENGGTTGGYAYNDGDGSTYFDVEYPLQIHGFDPNFHFVGMTFNPEEFNDMKDKYFLLNGRSYPDTVSAGPMATMTVDGKMHYSQPLPSIINIPAGKKALLRISDLDVTEYQTLASLGIPMQVIGYNAKLLRDQAGNNLYYTTNSITLAGGESST